MMEPAPKLCFHSTLPCAIRVQGIQHSGLLSGKHQIMSIRTLCQNHGGAEVMIEQSTLVGTVQTVMTNHAPRQEDVVRRRLEAPADGAGGKVNGPVPSRW